MNSQKKIISAGSLKRVLPQHRRQGRTIAFTNGCFDILHMGHIDYLERAKKTNRVLIVGLNSDRSISRIKGPNRPIAPQKARARVLAALAAVDYVVVFDEDTPYQLIKELQPDVLIKGADWKGKTVAGADLVGKVEFLKYLDGFSTTHTIETIIKSMD